MEWKGIMGKESEDNRKRGKEEKKGRVRKGDVKKEER